MTTEEFRSHAHRVADWMADYLENLETFPVIPAVKPGDIKKQLPAAAPAGGEPFEALFSDFQKIILPGMTHWQHPGFFGYFPANNSEPSILAEMLTATMGAQCMVWLTSPAAEELEERTLQWMRDIFGLPRDFAGVIQDSSSSATLVAILTAREKKTGFEINRRGFREADRFRVYTSTHGHSSIDKDVKIAGIGIENLVKVETDDRYAMRPDRLEEAILRDLRDGYLPLAVVSTFGTTSSTALDPCGTIGDICAKYGLWHHVDASYAGTALMLQEIRTMADGIEKCDSIVINAHKWMFTNFDCSLYFVRDKETLINTFTILPEYLKTDIDHQVNNYRDWGVPLGRRFRALKLWFVIRSYGVEGMQAMIREHIRAGHWLREQIVAHPAMELMAPVPFNLVCFRFLRPDMKDENEIDRLNEQILRKLNQSGRVFLTHTRLSGRYIIRLVAGQTHMTEDHVRKVWPFIVDQAMDVVNSGE